MALANSPRLASLGQVAALAFIVAGLGSLGNEVLYQFGSAEIVLDLTLLFTYSGVTLGLLGIYSRVADASPRLSRAGLAAVGLTVVSIVVAVIAKGLLGAEPSGWEVIVSMVVSVSFYLCSTLSFLLFGVACIRTRVPSWAVGSLLLAAVPSRVLVLTGLTEVASALFAVSMLGVGYFLWTGRFPSPNEQSQPNPATR